MTIGIDFGTSNTVVSVKQAGKSIVLSLGEDGEITPSLMFFEADGRLSIGNEARCDYARALSGTGDLSRKFRFFQGLKFALRDQYFSGTKLFGKRWTIEQLVGAFLMEIRKNTEEAIGGSSDLVILGLPVKLSADPAAENALSQRYNDACALAGYDNIRFVREPVAAMNSIASKGDGIRLVFDFGGGTLDITVADIRNGKPVVLANAGTDLGGYHLNEDISRARIIRHFGYGSAFKTMTGKLLEIPAWVTNQVASFYALPLADIVHTRATVKDLLHEARDRKKLLALIDFLDRNLAYELFEKIDDGEIALSSRDLVSIGFAVLPHLKFEEQISMAEFEVIANPRVAAAKALILEAVDAAGIYVDDVEAVVRVGGSSRIPVFTRMLEGLFPGRVSEGAIFTSISAGLIDAYENGLEVT